mgnify:CR=1 FL=1
MTKVCRLSDPHSHGGVVIEGSLDHHDEGLPVARVGDAAICPLHGIVHLTESGASKTTWVNGRHVTRVGTVLTCGAVMERGSHYWDDEG